MYLDKIISSKKSNLNRSSTIRAKSSIVVVVEHLKAGGVKRNRSSWIALRLSSDCVVSRRPRFHIDPPPIGQRYCSRGHQFTRSDPVGIGPNVRETHCRMETEENEQWK